LRRRARNDEQQATGDDERRRMDGRAHHRFISQADGRLRRASSSGRE
jgi:hypothetical protein